jgi:riboflavin biosynthesis pyrimidine reductase
MSTYRMWPAQDQASQMDLDDWADTYAYPGDPPDGWWLRANMVSTLGGAAVASDGLTRDISSDTDRALLGLLRALSDVIMVGASTAVAERYGPERAHPEHAHLRATAGQAPIAAMALVSRSLNLDLSAPLFTAAAVPTILLTVAEAPPDRLRAAREVADVALVGATAVDPALAVAALVERGHRRLLCEGGPRWLATITDAGLLDELCLTVSPLLLAGKAKRILDGPELAPPTQMHLASVCTDSENLFLRYSRVGDRKV